MATLFVGSQVQASSRHQTAREMEVGAAMMVEGGFGTVLSGLLVFMMSELSENAGQKVVSPVKLVSYVSAGTMIAGTILFSKAFLEMLFGFKEKTTRNDDETA